MFDSQDVPAESSGYIERYNGAKSLAGGYAMANTMKARIERAVEEAETRLADAKRAKEIFSAHPELEELLNIMQKGRF